jgi:hypothetical protein
VDLTLPARIDELKSRLIREAQGITRFSIALETRRTCWSSPRARPHEIAAQAGAVQTLRDLCRLTWSSMFAKLAGAAGNPQISLLHCLR